MAGHPQPQVYRSKSGKEYSHDAREILAIEDVDSKCDAIVTAAEQGCKDIIKKIKNVQIGKETLSVADSSLEPALEEVGTYIKSIASEGVEPSTEEIKSQAASKFAELQEKEDQKAKEECDAENARWEAEQAEKNKSSES